MQTDFKLGLEHFCKKEYILFLFIKGWSAQISEENIHVHIVQLWIVLLKVEYFLTIDSSLVILSLGCNHKYRINSI